MEKEKQIEEMAKIILDANCARKPCRECKYDADEVGMCMRMLEAEALYNAGYRKASEVVSEIFAEIEKMKLQKDFISRSQDFEFGYAIALADISELKNKYTEDGV